MVNSQETKQPTVTALSSWMLSGVRYALDAHESGEFRDSSLLAEALERNPRIRGALDTRVNGVIRLPFTVEGSSRIAKALGSEWWDIVPESTLKTLVRWYHLLGFAVAELVWDVTTWRPSLHVWHPANVRFDLTKNLFEAIPLVGSPIPITPGDGRWVLLADGPRPWMRGVIRCLGLDDTIRQYAIRDWARWSEKHGIPITKAYLPSGKASTDDAKLFIQSLRTMGSEGVLKLPRGSDDAASFDAEYMEPSGDSWRGFDRLIETRNVDIAIAILGQNLTTEVQGGSYAAANVHDSVRHEYIEADVAVFSTSLREQIIKPLVGFRFGDPNKAPWPVWDTKRPEDRSATATTHKVAAEALAGWRAQGVNVDRVAYAKRFDLPVVEGEEVVEVEAQPLRQRMVRLSSGDSPADASGFVNGQEYADRLVANNVRTEDMQPTIAALRELIDGIEDAPDWPDRLKSKLRSLYRGLDGEALATTMARALELAECGGRLAVMEDL